MSDNLSAVIAGRAAKARVEVSDSAKLELAVGDQALLRLTGTFTFPSQYKPGEQVEGWEFENADGDKIGFTHRGNVKYEMARSGAEVGDDVLIERMPDEKTKNNRMAQTYAITAYPAA